MKRRQFLQNATLVTAGLMFDSRTFAQMKSNFPSVRIPETERKFKSARIEKAIDEVKKLKTNDLIYQNTRQFVLSPANPYFFKGKAAEGVGGPHIGIDYVWHLGIIMRGLTSDNDREIKICLDMLQTTHSETYFMHEAFYKDDAAKFTRKWFAWANTLFGELILKIYREQRHLLR
jgi:meiotically up-regulated gene 157 (Mug157) protein